jgi:hypothetical protein
MPTRSPSNNALNPGQRGQSLLVTVIILALIGALGMAGLHVADLNMRMAANERDARDAFFLADSGVNIGHVLLESALENANASFYDDGSNASVWQSETTFNPDDFATALAGPAGGTTHIRCGMLRRDHVPGAAVPIGGGYDGEGLSASHGGVSTTFLIRALSVGKRGSRAQVDLGWLHVIR